MQCKFCKTGDIIHTDFYLCDECESIMCCNCMWTSTRTGKDFCIFCEKNLRWVGEVI